MAKVVGLSRPIKMEWLNKTVELIKQGKSEIEIKNDLNEYLGFEITSPTNLRKTREILMNIWVKTPEELNYIKSMALEVFDNERVNRLVIHWCMILLTYPVFLDVCALIGKMTDIQEVFTTRWLKEKLFDIWGERTTLLHSIDKILQTLKYIGSIENEKKGTYKVKTYDIPDETARNLIILTVIAIKKRAYYELSELSKTPEMFPFDYSVSHEVLHDSEMFSLTNFGGKVVLTVE
ncbi:hypothetical protein [Bacillus sp. JJ1562]|uniref:hypothetical protein n=1 Tax=Bacillus sp. JJ1562 TaxID=3122960 RepID=UPI0030011E42